MYIVTIKSNLRWSFVAFSEYMNFTFNEVYITYWKIKILPWRVKSLIGITEYIIWSYFLTYTAQLNIQLVYNLIVIIGFFLQSVNITGFLHKIHNLSVCDSYSPFQKILQGKPMEAPLTPINQVYTKLEN